MRCPACDEKISDGAWMCPHCEHIVDASFLGNDITNEPGWDGIDSETNETIEPPRNRQATRDLRPQTRDLVIPPDPPTDGLDVDQQMIVASLDDEDEEPLPAEPPTDDLGPVVKEVRALGVPKSPDDKIDTKPLPDEILPSSGLRPLDPSLLQELDEPPELAEPAPLVIGQPKKKGLPALKKAEPAEDVDSKKRDVLARAMARGPVQERRRSGEDKPASPIPAAATVPASPPPSMQQPTPTQSQRPPPEVIVRSSKAEKIFQQALEDVAAGNLISARTNIKLALTFDPGNDRYKEKLAEVEQEAGPNLGSQDLEEIPKGSQFANQFYEKAVDQENQGNFDEAIRLLEKAIRADAQGVYYHRLGNILAFHKGQLKEGRNMVDKAIQRSPRNKNYQKTLSRILEKMNGGEEKKKVADMIGGLLKRK
jgi:tetratricopeptide (TPR) repeat protein